MSDEAQSVVVCEPDGQTHQIQLLQGEAIKSQQTHYLEGSQIGSISIRGLLAILIVVTLCSMQVMKIDITEPFYTMSTVVISFYFGHQVGQTVTRPK